MQMPIKRPLSRIPGGIVMAPLPVGVVINIFFRATPGFSSAMPERV